MTASDPNPPAPTLVPASASNEMSYKPIGSPDQTQELLPHNSEEQFVRPYPPRPDHDELTEEEREEYEKGILTWSKVKSWRFWIRKEWTWYYILFVLLVVVVALMAFFHKDVSSH
jgi:hypothetical protein